MFGAVVGDGEGDPQMRQLDLPFLLTEALSVVGPAPLAVLQDRVLTAEELLGAALHEFVRVFREAKTIILGVLGQGPAKGELHSSLLSVEVEDVDIAGGGS